MLTIFQGPFVLRKKVDLYKTLLKFTPKFPRFYNFHPKTFILPSQNVDLKMHMQSLPKNRRTYIVKPTKGSEGKGIILIQNPEDAENFENLSVAQKYISPFLIDDLKFDFRIYALVTSYDPVRIYIYREGLARFCTEKYVKPSSKNLGHVFGHLTNYSLNIMNKNFQKNKNADESNVGHKRTFTSVMNEIAKLGGNIEQIQKDIDNLIIFTIFAARPNILHKYKSCFKHVDRKSRCFENLGFDVLIDSKFKPWLLEVNLNPSLKCDTPFDKQLKDTLVSEALRIVDLDPCFRKKVQKNRKGNGNSKNLWRSCTKSGYQH